MAYVQFPKPKPVLARAKAALLLQRATEQARAINADPEAYPFAVRRLHVFGSFLTDKDPLGDLDLALELVMVRPASDLLHLRPHWRPVHWWDKTARALQVRHPRVVSVHLHQEVQEMGLPMQLVFEDPSVTPAGAKRI